MKLARASCQCSHQDARLEPFGCGPTALLLSYGNKVYPRRESNSDAPLRGRCLYPLRYGGREVALPEIESGFARRGRAVLGR